MFVEYNIYNVHHIRQAKRPLSICIYGINTGGPRKSSLVLTILDICEGDTNGSSSEQFAL